jgi:predicted RNA-binding protein with PIN domain
VERFMSLHYLLDGYNIIKQVPHLDARSLEDSRKELIRWLNVERPQGSRNNDVTVVFDGKIDIWNQHDGGCVSVVFSQYNSADDVIKHTIEDAKDKRKYVVVSNDKGIVLYVRAMGAKILSVAVFMGKYSKGSHSHSGGNTQSKKNISLSNQVEINKELSKLWLKDK